MLRGIAQEKGRRSQEGDRGGETLEERDLSNTVDSNTAICDNNGCCVMRVGIVHSFYHCEALSQTCLSEFVVKDGYCMATSYP